MKTTLIAIATLFILGFSPSMAAQDMKQELQKKLAAVKESVARNQIALRQYTWTEHTEIILKGEVKSTKENICRYGPDGKVQKTPLGPPPQQKQMRGMKKKIAEKKKGELTDYMDRAAALIHRYVPPSPQQMEAVFQNGNASIGQAGPDKIQLQFKDYFKPGDSLVFNFDTTAKALTNVSINSYLDDPKDDVVTLAVNFASLPDGTNYTASTILDAPAKKVQVKTTNSNHQRALQ